MPDTLLIKNCIAVQPFRETALSDILIEDGRISSVGKNIEGKGGRIIDANGLYAGPGLVDMHVHLRDPGYTYKEDIISGCRAAAAGGVTSVAAMPNTKPVADSPEVLLYVINKANKTGIHVYPIAAVTKGQNGIEAVDFDSLKKSGAIAFSDDGKPVEKASMMLKAMKASQLLKVPVISHCEDLSLADGGIVNEGIAHKLNVKGISGAAEEVQIAREIALSAHYGLPVHIAHISTALSAGLIRSAKQRGVHVTCETCPHYFSFDESFLLNRDADYRMNPPLRGKKDVNAIIEALKDGTIDAIATDHAPHSASEKACFETAPNGVTGLETSLAAAITFLVKPGHLSLEALFRLMSFNPAKILNINAGTLNTGAPADIVLFDPDETFTVEPANLKSKSQNTPFKGMVLSGMVKYTISGGKIIYKYGSEAPHFYGTDS